MRTAILAALAALFLVTQAKANTVEDCKAYVQLIDVGLKAKSNGVDMLEAAERMLQALPEIYPLLEPSAAEKMAYALAARIYSMHPTTFEILGGSDALKAEVMKQCLDGRFTGR